MFKIFNRYWLKPAVFALGGELMVLTMAGWLAFWARFWHRPEVFLTDSLTGARIASFAIIFCISIYFNDLYDFSQHFSIRSLAIRLLRAATFAALGLWAVFYVVPALFMGRGVLAFAFLISSLPIIFWRVLVHRYLAVALFPERILLLGSGESAQEIAREILRRDHLGYKLLGFLDDDPEMLGVSIVNPRVIGAGSMVAEVAAQHQATRVVVAQRDHRGKLDLDALLRCKTQGTPVERGADFLEKLTGKVALGGFESVLG